jgi:Ca2+/H+ antiporter, TMEM165/GDT1 family
MILRILTVVLMSTFEIYVAIATGLGFGLSPHVICAATLTGGIGGALIATFLGDKIKAFILKFKKPKTEVAKEPSRRDKIFRSLWDKYGMFGVGFLGTFILGALPSIAISYSFGADKKKLLKWVILAVVIRCVAYSYFFDYLKNLF